VKSEEATPVVEIIDDDSNPFGDRGSNHTVNDTGGPRWIGAVAAATLIAIIGFGVATSGSTGAPKVAPPPASTTVPRPTTTVPTSSTVGSPLIRDHYAASPPQDFTIAFADAGEVGRAFFPGQYKLWATDGASSTEGSWFSVQTKPGPPYSPNAYRVEANGLSIAISHTADRLSVATFAATEAGSVTITALGWTDADLVRLAQSLRIGRATMSITDATLTQGYQVISSLAPARVIIGTPVETVFYQSTKDPASGFGLQIAPRDAPNLGGSDAARETALRFGLDQPTPFDVDGHPALAGPVTGQDGVALATWIADDHMVTLSGSMTVPELIDLAGTVRKVSANAWFDMQSHTTGDPAVFGNVRQGQPIHVSLGTDSTGQAWVIDAAVTQFATQQQIEWQWAGGSGFTAHAADTAQIDTVVEGGRTYVLADLPRSVAAIGQLEIDRAGLDPVIVPFNDLGGHFDRTLAAYAFTEPAQFTARIVAQDGTVVAAWPR